MSTYIWGCVTLFLILLDNEPRAHRKEPETFTKCLFLAIAWPVTIFVTFLSLVGAFDDE